MKKRNAAGATLLEIVIAMMVIGLVAAGIMKSFVTSRRLSHRSGSELSTMGLVEEVSEQLRAAAQAPLPNGLTLARGVYVDDFMLAGARPPGAVVLPAPNPLNLPADFRARFQTNQGRTPAATWVDHADGRVYVVEDGVDANGNGTIDPGELDDLDGDGLTAIDFDGRFPVDLRRVRVKVRFTTPNVQ